MRDRLALLCLAALSSVWVSSGYGPGPSASAGSRVGCLGPRGRGKGSGSAVVFGGGGGVRRSCRGEGLTLRLSAKGKGEGEGEDAESSPLEALSNFLQTPFGLEVPWKPLGGGFVLGVALSAALLQVALSPGAVSQAARDGIDLFDNVLLDLERAYVTPVDVPRLTETALVAMARTLDPYTEYQGKTAAADMKEVVSGRYGGVGLVISRTGRNSSGEKTPSSGPASPSRSSSTTEAAERKGSRNNEASSGGLDIKSGKGKGGALPVSMGSNPIRVVSAFEGYAFDEGVRPGDTILAVDGTPVDSLSVEKVKDLLRGPPNSDVTVTLQRDARPGGSSEPQDFVLHRQLVRLRDLKLSTLVGEPNLGIGYINLAGFSQGSGTEVAEAIVGLQLQAKLAQAETNVQVAKTGLHALIIDVRGNPGGLLDSAVEVSTLFLDKGSSIVSTQGRAFPSVKYLSNTSPLLDSGTRLAVLTNGGSASASEILAGAIQDHDRGIIVGSGKTYGKGLVQTITPLPSGSALKYTVALYYTPSGRCIQSVKFKEGGVPVISSEDSQAPTEDKGEQSGIFGGNLYSFEVSSIPESDRKEFRTDRGRIVRDGGGIEPDVLVSLPKGSVLEGTLQGLGAYFDYAGEWSKTHKFSHADNLVSDATVSDFKRWVLSKQKDGEYQLDAAFEPAFRRLEKDLSALGLGEVAEKDIPQIRDHIAREISRDFEERKGDIKEELRGAILSRYLPESMLIKEQLKTDAQFKEALALVMDPHKYDALLQAPPGYFEAAQEPSLQAVDDSGLARGVANGGAQMDWH